MEIYLDGERIDVPEGTLLGDLLPKRDKRCTVAIIRHAEEEATETETIRIVSTAGEIVVEKSGTGTYRLPLDDPGFSEHLTLRWADRYSAAFGPFKSTLSPARQPFRYDRGDVVLGCGGYDPGRSYLIFSRMGHTADHGAPVGGGIVGRVVSGKSVLDHWTEGDRILEFERLRSQADRSRAFSTVDSALPLEDGMHVVSHVQVALEGFDGPAVDTRTARSAEHFLLAMQHGLFSVDRSSSTHIRDERLVRTKVPAEMIGPRLAGVVTVRTSGRSEGAVYLYTADVPASPAHTVVGRVTHGLELADLANDGDTLCIRVTPEKFDLIGITLGEARAVAAGRGIRFIADDSDDDRVVVDQNPPTTLGVLGAGEVAVTTMPFAQVIGVRLDDEHAPLSCGILREVTGLKTHPVGKIPFYFKFEDVYLFRPSIARGTGIIPENVPEGVVPANTLAMTNDSRKGDGMVGVRTTESSEFGPTSEPFSGTNIVGTIVDPEKLEGLKEGTMVYIREVT
jgi:putative methanogenesis marker protein 3